ncbi:MAG: 3'-5' exonuclease [Prevotellaceae bacterium]|nr:3'-5' exonuclease [Prevotellaceae bacterium]
MKKINEKDEYPIRNQDEDKTESCWAMYGYAIKDNHKGVRKYTDETFSKTEVYFCKDDVYPDIIKAGKVLKQLYERSIQKRKEEKLAEEQAIRREKENKILQNKDEWKKFLQQSKRIVVFDTETTGVNVKNDYILSLSWQVLDSNLETIDRQTRFFNNPIPENLCARALRINGLTNDALMKLGISEKKQSLEEFIAIDPDLFIGHNVHFDQKFVKKECQRENVDFIFDKSTKWFDTMTSMIGFCNLQYSFGFKNPKLSELADALDVDTSDIDWHRSDSDVEATVRCFRKIVERGLSTPFPF